jgi:hypothetical protein
MLYQLIFSVTLKLQIGLSYVKMFVPPHTTQHTHHTPHTLCPHTCILCATTHLTHFSAFSTNIVLQLWPFVLSLDECKLNLSVQLALVYSFKTEEELESDHA